MGAVQSPSVSAAASEDAQITRTMRMIEAATALVGVSWNQKVSLYVSSHRSQKEYGEDR